MIFKNIINTTGTRIINAVFNFIILLLMTRFIGKEGLGTVGLLVVDITLIQLLIDFLGGSALVYFASRFSVSRMLFIAYLWNIFIVTFIGLIFGYLFHLFPGFQEMILPGGFGFWVLMMALFNGWMQIHFNLLIGLKKIRTYNLLFFLQVSLFLLGFLFLIFVVKQISPLSYLQALLLSWIITAIAGLIALRKDLKHFSVNHLFSNTGKIMLYGLATSAGNTVHIVNKRLSFYFVRVLNGLAPLGILTAAVQLTEGLRIIAQSIALVQFSAISNSDDKEYARNLTIKSMKFALTISFIALLVLLIIPTSFYGMIFSRSFMQIKSVVLSLSPAVLALAANAVFSHYFSGTGQPKINLYANIAGFVVTILLAFLLIEPFGIIGAAWVASGSYVTSALYQYFVFRKQTQTPWKDWLILRNDFNAFMQLSRKLFLVNKA
ncbi:MAG: polysaccharide biosynthesis C-terminal domain-containing protein [Bacteroidales bacterium]|nr:polysaccharide biosynthesis C-terminal domain-containing protein [Bacteroidales bacterium]